MQGEVLTLLVLVEYLAVEGRVVHLTLGGREGYEGGAGAAPPNSARVAITHHGREVTLLRGRRAHVIDTLLTQYKQQQQQRTLHNEMHRHNIYLSHPNWQQSAVRAAVCSTSNSIHVTLNQRGYSAEMVLRRSVSRCRGQ